MTRMFRDKIGHTVEVYIDDIVVKSKQETRHIEDLQGVFKVFQQHKLRLNADKCALGVGAAPKPGEDLLIYLSVFDHAVTAVLLRDHKVQWPVYYISKTLVDAKTRYLPLEKLVLALVHAIRKLPHYFQACTIYVLTEYPLQLLLKRFDFTGRIAKWGTWLGSFNIRYRPRRSVKGQVFIDFVAESSPKNEGQMVCHVECYPWKVFVDGALSCWDCHYHPRRNTVGAQVQGSFEARDSRMKEYLQVVMQVMSKFCTVKLAQLARGQNRHVDSLATLASSMTKDVPWLIKVELIVEPSINVAVGVGVAVISTTDPCWMDPIIDFLAEDRVLDDEKKANRVVAAPYWFSKDHKLYWRSFRGLYLLCLHLEKLNELLAELHDGVCGNHVGGMLISTPSNNSGVLVATNAEGCHRVCHLNPINIPWPFAQWRLDILGPFPRDTGNQKFVLVAVDYFTKWAEAGALANIQDVDVKKFVWNNIVTRFGVPDSVISDNGLQFDSRAFHKFCNDLSIKNRYSTPAYPRSNGQAEATNKTIVNGLKKRLDSEKGRWVEELPNVLWAYRTTPGGL
nr:uncharacterized protein LOC112005238 [Quercus suber]